MCLKIVHLPTTVGGNPNSLSRFLNEIGLHSTCIALQQNYLQYQTDKIIAPEKCGILKLEIRKLLNLFYFVGYDVVFFNYGRTLFAPVCVNNAIVSRKYLKYFLLLAYNIYQTFMQYIELNLIKSLGKKIFVLYQGDDARQGDFISKNFNINIASRVSTSYYNKRSDELKKSQICTFTKYADKIYSLNPDLLYVLPYWAKFLPYSNISPEEVLPNYTAYINRPLRVAHAPSHRDVKGTDIILSAINRINHDRTFIELELVENMPNIQALEVYKTVDVVIDQLFAGWYGGFAVEAMALGKPVIVYIRMDDLKFVPQEMVEDMPFICSTPYDIEQTLQEVVKLNNSDLHKISLKSRRYVEKWHNPISIANNIKKDILQSFNMVII